VVRELREQCRDVPWHVWELREQGELRELRELTQNSTLPVPCSLTNDK